MRTARVVAPAGTVLLVAAGWLGCAAVPELRFVPDDASLAEGGDGGGGGDATKPGTDGATDGAGNDAAACKAASPGAGARCCGAVWCEGDCTTSNCDECAAKGCAADEVCCGKTGTVQCKARCP